MNGFIQCNCSDCGKPKIHNYDKFYIICEDCHGRTQEINYAECDVCESVSELEDEIWYLNREIRELENKISRLEKNNA
jgi:hypothetical protein